MDALQWRCHQHGIADDAKRKSKTHLRMSDRELQHSYDQEK